MLNSIAGFSCALHMATGCGAHSHMHTKSYVKEDLCCKALMGANIIEGKLIPEANKALLQLPAIGVEKYAAHSLIFVVHTGTDHNEFTDHWFWPPKRDIRITIQSFQI